MVNSITSEQEIFRGMDIEATINEYVVSINSTGVLFLKQYLKELSMQELSAEEQLNIVDFAIRTIYADNKIEYSKSNSSRKFAAGCH